MSTTTDIPFLSEPVQCEIPTGAGASPGPETDAALRAAATPVRFPLARIERIATAVADKLRAAAPGLVVEIAGSIRRRRAFCGDIDLVVLGNRDAVIAALRRGCRIVSNGQQNVIAEWTLAEGATMQLDVFFARPRGATLFEPTPSNFGSLLLCRTGSAAHNIYLVETAKRQGLRWQPYEGVWHDGQLIASETEAAIFAALNLSYIKPEDRER